MGFRTLAAEALRELQAEKDATILKREAAGDTLKVENKALSERLETTGPAFLGWKLDNGAGRQKTEQRLAMKRTSLAILSLGLGVATALGQSNSSSASYKLLHAPLTGGGGQVGNGSNITAQISVGDDFAGAVSNITAGGVQEKPNYIGQLYDVTAVAVNATPNTVDETSTRQLSATATLDDLTLLALAAAEVQWSVFLGPLTGIDASGLATADAVFADTSATAQGSFQGVNGQLGLTVLNTNPDNFRAYAGDGLSDGWQVDFFGSPPNSNAAPAANPDNDPYDNRTEFLTGYDPTDADDFFQLKVIELTGSSATLELSKIIPGTRYHLERSVDLEQTDPWSEFANFTTLSKIFDHQLNDPNSTGARWFYRVGVEPE